VIVLSDKTFRNNAKEVIFKVFETRRAIDEALRLKEQNVLLSDIKNSKRKEIDPSLWNELGIYFLNNRMYLDALMIYEHMLQTISNTEKQGVDIHKGLPLHNIGVAQINLRNYDEGIPNILKAYEEDVKSLGSAEAEKQLAYRVKEGLFDFVSRVIDNNYLKEFNANAGLKVKDTISLMQNMDEAEKLFFAKTVNSKKLVTFHDDIYTRVTMFDNLKNLGLLLESNLKRRSHRTEQLPGLVTNIFKESWKRDYEAARSKDLTCYSSVGDFEKKLEIIEKLKLSGKPGDDFLTNNFLTTTLVRNFTAHYLNEKLNILSDSKEYDRVFAREIFSILYSLVYTVK
jgi:tetratricopeptide (TPR) repeat protein